jgi:cellulose biosynthesis protein BcsQ
MYVIAIANQKGGCDKKLLRPLVWALFWLKKKQSLLIDVDSHAHATIGVSQTAIENTATVVPALVDRGLETGVIFEAIRQIEDGFDFVPTDQQLVQQPRR